MDEDGTSKRKAEMKQRIKTGVLFACLFLGLLTLYPTPPWDLVFLALLTLITWLGIREYCQLVWVKGEQVDCLWAYLTALIYPVIHYAVLREYLPAQAELLFGWTALLSLLSLALISPKVSLTRVALTVFGFCYIVVPLGEIITLAYTPIWSDDLRLWLLYGIGMTKITDTAALFIGRYCGRHALAPQLSPKKTWEGAIGGIVVGCLWSLAFAFLSQISIFKITLSYGEALFLGVLLPVLGQVGDMVESLFKRDAGIKDSGFIPGLGGVLDLVDSLIFTIPVLTCFLRVRSMLG